MGISDRKEREKKKLKARIMEATARILMEEGYEKTTIRKVSEAIEYSPRTVYLYFRDKDALLMEIIEEGFASTLEKRRKLESSLDYSKPDQIFGLQVLANIQTAISSPHLYKAIVYLIQYKAYPPGPKQLEVIAKVQSDIEMCYKHLKREVIDAEQKAELLFAFIRGFNMMLINKLDTITKENLEAYKKSCLNIVLKGIVDL